MKTLGLTAERARELLSYDPETGVLVRLVSQRNPRLVGKPAGTVNSEGYLQARVDGRTHKAHRLAWLLRYGEWPDGQIDHINGVRTDNRIANLRVATNAENQRNAAVRGDNTSGLAGVYWADQQQRWRACINTNGKQTHLGSFDNLFDAACARKSAELAHGYHPNHGRRAA